MAQSGHQQPFTSTAIMVLDVPSVRSAIRFATSWVKTPFDPRAAVLHPPVSIMLPVDQR